MIAMKSNRINNLKKFLLKNALNKFFYFKRLKGDEKFKISLFCVFILSCLLYSSIITGLYPNLYSSGSKNNKTNIISNFNYSENKISTQSRENPNFGDTIWTMKINSPLVNFDFSPDGRYLVTEHKNRKLYIWDITTGELLKTLTQTFFILKIKFSPNGLFLALLTSNGVNEYIEVLKTDNWVIYATFYAEKSISDFTFSYDSTLLIIIEEGIWANNTYLL